LESEADTPGIAGVLSAWFTDPWLFALAGLSLNATPRPDIAYTLPAARNTGSGVVWQ